RTSCISAPSRETLDSSLGHRHFLFAFRSHRLVVLLAGQRFRPRFRISCCFLAGHRLPVEGRHYLPALDCLDEPRFRRAALHLLSAAFLDSWRCSQPGSSRDVDPSCIHRSGPDLCGPLGVLSTPPARQRTCGHPGAACYVINPYALLLTYIRSDFAEQLACAIFPLLLLAALRLANLLDPPSPK